jgi:adenylate cyclase class 2
MLEIEVKILEIDRKKIEEKLISLGAKKLFNDDIHAIYYDFSDNSIMKSKGTFRLRKEGIKTMVTFKHYIENAEAKIREEKEVEVSDFTKMKLIIESLGLSGLLEMKKHRTTYEYDGILFELDKYKYEYEYIPEFLEIEGADIETIYKYVELLGYTKHDCKTWDALQVADYYSSCK